MKFLGSMFCFGTLMEACIGSLVEPQTTGLIVVTGTDEVLKVASA